MSPMRKHHNVLNQNSGSQSDEQFAIMKSEIKIENQRD